MAMNKQQLQKKGPKGHKLAHITPLEGVILEALGGSGRVNPQTKIEQYDSGPPGHTHTYGNTGGGPQQQDDPPDYGNTGGGPQQQDDPPDYGGDDDADGHDSSQDDPSGTGGTTDPGGVLVNGEVGTTGGDGKSNWSYDPFSNDWADLDVGRWWSEVAVPWFKETFGREPTPQEKKNLEKEHTTGGDGSTVATENVTTYEDWDGGVHDTQTGADNYNQGIRDTKFGEIGAYEHGESGTGYASAYEQVLADAYSAAQTGGNREIMQLGYDPGTGVTEADLTEQQEWLTGLGTAYEAKNKAMYDTWYAENRAAIDAIDDPAQIANYVWTDAPAYDLDYTGGSAYGTDTTAEDYAYNPDYIPDFFEGYNLEYGPGYKDPTMPDEWGGYGEGEEGGQAPVYDEPVSTPEQEASGTGYTNPYLGPGQKKKTRIKAPTSVGLNPFSGGSAKYN